MNVVEPSRPGLSVLGQIAAVWLVPGALIATGCQNDASDLYARPSTQRDAAADSAPRDSGAASARRRTPYASALAIYGDEAACLACVESSCETLARQCADQESCRLDAECRAGCAGNPSCEWSCKIEQPKFERPTFDLERCIIEACVQDCRVGRNYDCAGEYGPTLRDPDEEVVFIWEPKVGLAFEPAPEGIRARVCAITDLDCAAPESETVSDENGRLRIEWPKPPMFGGSAQFDGYVEFSDLHDPPRFVPALVVTNLDQMSNPAEWPVETLLLSPDDIATYAALAETTYDVTQGVISGVLYDCRVSELMRGAGARFALSPEGPETRYFYPLDPNASETSMDAMYGGGIAVFRPVPGFAAVTASYQDQTIAQVSAPVRAGAMTSVILAPK